MVDRSQQQPSRGFQRGHNRSGASEGGETDKNTCLVYTIYHAYTSGHKEGARAARVCACAGTPAPLRGAEAKRGGGRTETTITCMQQHPPAIRSQARAAVVAGATRQLFPKITDEASASALDLLLLYFQQAFLPLRGCPSRVPGF